MEKRKKSSQFYVLWITQSLSQLGSAATSFALTLWLYEKTGSALSTAALSIFTYVPYVLVSIFAGAFSDKYDKKRTMLLCDLTTALSTVLVFYLYRSGRLQMYHLYLINAFAGLMNTLQQPSSEVAYTLIVEKEFYQKMNAMLYLSRSLISVGCPLIASALYGIKGLETVILFDLGSFLVAFLSLLFLIRIPKIEEKNDKEDIIRLTKEGFRFLKETPLILNVILFMAGVNLVASAFDAVLPALVIPQRGNEVLGYVSSCSGIAMVLGSLVASVLPKPKDRVRMIYLTMLFSLGTENFLLSFSRDPIVWCVGQFLGWSLVPIMSTNLQVIMRSCIPAQLQGRVYACRNSLQFFTIPIGLFLGGFLTDEVCEPLMENAPDFMKTLFGTGKGSGAALMMFVLGVAGIVLCLVMGRRLKGYEYRED